MKVWSSMICLLTSWYRKFVPSLPSERDIFEQDREIRSRLVARFSRGNINLQQGKFVTQQQSDQWWREVKNYEF